MNEREKGYIGEEVASEYLEKCGYEILERNYTVKGAGELDIIAKDGNTLVFVEVKSRRKTADGCPASEAVDNIKLSRIVRCAKRYVFEKSDVTRGLKIRFDCIEVYFPDGRFDAKKAEIRHIKDIDVT